MSVEFRKKFKRKKILSFASAAVVAFTMTAAPVFGAADSGNTKDETVYVVTESDGSQSDLIVSDHLKNKSGSDKIEDVSTLTDIENVKGDEKFEREDNGTLSWNAKGNDIYYQGKTDKEAPVSMDIKYYLNDKEVKGADLEGKTGKVKIVINYTNNAEYNGVKVPFVVLTGMVLENDTFQNVTVSSGKVIDDGEKSFIVGMAAPGIADSLGISEDELGFGSTVEITGDAEKFAPEDMMSIVTNDFFQDIDLGELNAGDLDSQIEQLDSAAKELVEGTNTLYEGIETLNSSTDALATGVDKLNQGASKLNEGTKDALQGSQKLAAGSQQLSSKLTSKLSELGNGVSQMNTAAGAISQYAAAISTGLDGTDENPGLVKGSDNLVSGMKKAKETLDKGAQADKTALEYLEQRHASGDISDTDYTQLKTLIEGSQSAQTGVSESMDTTGALGSGAAKIAAGMKQLKGAVSGDGTEKNPGLANVSGKLSAGVKEMAEQLGAATSENGELSTGLKQLVTGSSALMEGETQLSDGASELAAGMSELNSKSGLLISGIGQLDAGSKKLNEGMSRFYEEGIGKIVSLYNEKLKGTVNNAGELIAAGKAYNTFTQVPEGMDGSVKFIYKTKVAD